MQNLLHQILDAIGNKIHPFFFTTKKNCDTEMNYSVLPTCFEMFLPSSFSWVTGRELDNPLHMSQEQNRSIVHLWVFSFLQSQKALSGCFARNDNITGFSPALIICLTLINTRCISCCGVSVTF